MASLVGTLGDPGMAWDEGITIRRQERIRAWFGELVRPRELPSRWMALEPRRILNLADRTYGPYGPLYSYWPYTRVIEGHPPFYGMVGVIGWVLSHRWLAPLEAHRFGPALLFSITAGAMYLSLAGRYRAVAGLCGAASLAALPRMFAHAHLASYDAPVTCFWVLAWASFLPARENGRWRIVLGVMLGLAMATKFTGWLAPVPLAVWCLVYRDWRGAKSLAIGLAVALVTFFVVNPPLWHHPITGMQDFFSLNLQRGQTRGLNISTVFLGGSYDLDRSLPWFNTLFWTVVAVPIGTLGLAIAGLGRILASGLRDRAGTLVLLNWATMMVLRALPGAPPHDGIRLFLPSFAFLAALAGIGALGLWQGMGYGLQATGYGPEATDYRLRATGRCVTVLALAGAAFSTWFYHPCQLSHYSLLIGGLPGGVRAGMEPTYYWDALTRDVREWLNAHTAEGETILFSTEQDSWAYLNRWPSARGGRQPMLRPPAGALAQGKRRWYVLQLRPSSYRAVDRRLLGASKPVYVKYLHDPARFGWGALRLDVPLMHIYSFDEYLRAVRETSRRNS